MVKTVDFDIVGSYNNQRVSSIDAERSVNLFEYIDPLGKKPKSLINTSGLNDTLSTYTGATNGFRAQFVFNSFEYSVIGNKIFRKNTSGTITPIGTITTSSGYVGVDANTFQIIFVDGVNGYIFDTNTGVFTQITDPAFPTAPFDVCYLDGFFVVIKGNTNQFQLSMFNQGLVWGADYTLNTGNTFVATSGGSPNLVLTTGTTANYQVGTPITFNGAGTLPVGTPPITTNTTYYVKTVVNTTTFTISVTNGGAAITFSTTGSGAIYLTNNGQLQLAQVTTHPGTLVACKTLHRKLFLFCQFFTEVWENAGAATNLPFRRNNSLLMEYGTPAVGSISVGFDKMFFLSQDRDGLGSVMEVVGSISVPVSNRALDFQLSQYAANPTDLGVSDCRSFLIKENGIIFYRMNFTQANHTFVYNVTLSDPSSEEGKLWHEEEVLNGDRHPAQTHAYFNGKNYVGSYFEPVSYILDPNTFTNAGERIRRMRITRPIVPAGYQRTRIDRLQIDILQGDIPLAFISNPQNIFVYLSISKDGGQTYGSADPAPIGNLGQRTFRTLWRKKGVIPRGQPFVAKFEFYGASRFVVLGASWAYEVLPE